MATDDKFMVEINLSAKISFSPSLSENLSATMSEAMEKLSTSLSELVNKKPPSTPSSLSDPQITLKSSDGLEFAISKSAAAMSGTLSATIEELLSRPQIEFNIPCVDGKTLDVVVTYLNGRAAARNDEEATNKFYSKFLPVRHTPKGVLIDVYLAAESLQIPDLVDKIVEKLKA